MGKAKNRGASKIKLTNKSTNKKAKSVRRHKLNKQALKKKEVNLPQAGRKQNVKPQKKVNYARDDEGDNIDEISDEEISDDEMKQYLSNNSNSLSFLSTKLISSGKKYGKDVEEDYEKVPRKLSRQSESYDSNRVHLLPIKEDQGKVIARSRKGNVESEKGEAIALQMDESNNDRVSMEEEPKSFIELFAKRKKETSEMKLQIALLSQSIIEDPEGKIGSLKQLLSFCSKGKPLLIKKLSILSLLEIFKDIIPSYRIRELSEAEKSAKVTSDVSRLRNFEECLLSSYQQYLQLLEDLLKDGLKQSRISIKDFTHRQEGRFKSAYSLGIIAIKALCELMINNEHFNYRTNIIGVIVPNMELEEDWSEVGSTCVEAIKSIFKSDKTGEVSLEVVKIVHKLVKSKAQIKPQVLETFLYLRINTDLIRLAQQKGDKIERLKEKREAIRKMSRKERKRKKIEDKLTKELQEAEAVESQEKISRYQTEIVKLVFVTYFRILKAGHTHQAVLSMVLKGLSKYAHLINIEFFDDLMAILRQLLCKEDLGINERLNCINAAFKILSGQGEVLTIDPRQFYTELYNILLFVTPGTEEKDFNLTKDCLMTMLIHRRKQVSAPQIFGLFKRMATTLLQANPAQVFHLLLLIRNVLQLHHKCDYLLDNEVFGSGVFQPDVVDPEHSNADSTALWDLLLLSKHYHPDTEIFAKHILNGAPSQGTGALPPRILNRLSDASLGKQVLDTSINLADYFHPGIQEKVNIKKSKGFIETYRSLDFNKFIEEKTDILSKQINDYFPEFLSSNTYR